jgi:hypothetical protein
MIRTKHIIFLFIIYLLFLFSCENTDTEKGSIEKEKSPGIHESVERGPVRVTLDIDKKDISIADRINLTISVEIEEDYKVDMPSFGDKLEQFGIVDYRNEQPELKGESIKLISRSYVLEPFLSGEYKISPMKIFFYREQEGQEEKHHIETPEVVVDVRSLLPGDIKDLKLNEIIPPLPYPVSYKIWIWTGAGLLLISVSAVLFFLYRKRLKRNGAPAVRLKAHEVAYNELKALVDENLIEKGDIKQFYLKLSAIIRRYIENRFGLRAPEQTTEEFLSGLENAFDFPAEYKPLLNNFLKHCDLVKFAKFEPVNEDIQKSFDSCKAFIQGTEERD